MSNFSRPRVTPVFSNFFDLIPIFLNSFLIFLRMFILFVCASNGGFPWVQLIFYKCACGVHPHLLESFVASPQSMCRGRRASDASRRLSASDAARFRIAVENQARFDSVAAGRGACTPHRLSAVPSLYPLKRWWTPRPRGLRSAADSL